MTAAWGCGDVERLWPIDQANTWDSRNDYICRRALGPISMDNTDHADQWAHAMVISRFLVPVTLDTPKDPTEMRMLWDDDNLYIHFVAYDADLMGTYTNRTDPLYSEDAVEVFFQPDLTRGAYYEFEVNPINTLMALRFAQRRKGTIAWKSNWPYSIRRVTRLDGTVNDSSDSDAYFRVIVAIPFKDLEFGDRKTPAAGAKWRFIGARCNKSTHWQEQELSACVKLPKVDFHINPHWRHMVFAR